MSIKSNDKIYVIIPAFNEEPVISQVIKSVQQEGFENIIVVNDGSFDNTSTVAKETGCIVLDHLVNRGKGAATQTGMDAAKLLDADYAVTLDADGQHNPADIHEILKPLLSKEVDVSLGSRFLSKQPIPFSRVFANKVGNLITFLFYGIHVSDSQSGFRGYNTKALKTIYTTFDRYEFESEIIHQINIHQLKYKEVPITVSYSNYSQNKWKNINKGTQVSQTFLNGFNMLFRMIIRSITT
ncbi:MAG: glycosyltransferase family 2 protein [Candidatus Dojkabacteria bacterium]